MRCLASSLRRCRRAGPGPGDGRIRLFACVEIDPQACETLRLNRPGWDVVERDLRALVASLELEQLRGCDLLAGGVPCPPFSMAGKQLGGDDERDLFPAILDLAAQLRPRALLIENVRGLLSQRFAAYRENVVARLRWMGYPVAGWELLQAADSGVPQLRPRAVCRLPGRTSRPSVGRGQTGAEPPTRRWALRSPSHGLGRAGHTRPIGRRAQTG